MRNAKETRTKMMEAMDEIRSASDSTAAIVQEINDITKQTDVLASSAAGKAAKVRSSAGAFGVVAFKISSLSVSCKEAAATLKILLKTHVAQQSGQEHEQLQCLIDDLGKIAKVSNFLGINASIEASHVEAAGEAFEMLTDEVRQLARRSADSARKTELLINHSIGLAKKGQQITQELDGHMDAAVHAANSVERVTEAIALATTDSAHRIEEINVAVRDINDVTMRNVAAAGESMAAIADLEAQTIALDRLVKNFHC